MKIPGLLFLALWSIGFLIREDANPKAQAIVLRSSLQAAVSNKSTTQKKSAAKEESSSQVMFDDFNYTKHEQLTMHGWIVRTAPGWPGVPGAIWAKEGVSFLSDPDQQGNRILRMISSTGGPGSTTNQTQIFHQRKYLEGTYGARVRFTDNPLSGTGGDQMVESFYTISPLKAPMDLDYSELDFEDLPNGGLWYCETHSSWCTSRTTCKQHYPTRAKLFISS